MLSIKVCDFLKTSHLLSPDNGKKLRENVVEGLSTNDSVELDFQGYEYISSSFLNEILGKLLIDNQWSIGEIKQQVKWINISEDDETDFSIALENAETRLKLIKKNINPEEFYRKQLPAV